MSAGSPLACGSAASALDWLRCIAPAHSALYIAYGTMPRCKGCSSQLSAAEEEDTTLYCDGGCGKVLPPGCWMWSCDTDG